MYLTVWQYLDDACLTGRGISRVLHGRLSESKSCWVPKNQDVALRVAPSRIGLVRAQP